MRTIFITGTDTGVGKTLLTASLLHHLRSSAIRALAIKPFCSGARDDVKLLQALQPGELSDDEANPFYYRAAVAPLVAQQQHKGPKATLEQTLQHIRAIARRCETLLIEGSGGVMVPLGRAQIINHKSSIIDPEVFTAADLIKALKCNVIIAARNRLGTINHTLLTVEVLKKLRPKTIKVVLMDAGARDASTATNLQTLRGLLIANDLQYRPRIPVLMCPFLGQNPASLGGIRRNRKILQKMLAQVLT